MRQIRGPGACLEGTALPDVFLSYNREDQATARRYAEALSAQGFDVWWDTALKSGEAYDEVTESALREAKAVMVLWSTRAVASRWVRAEATIANRNGTMIPVMIEPCERPIMFELVQTADLSHWSGDTADPVWTGVVRDVRGFVDKLTAPKQAAPKQTTLKPAAPAPAAAPRPAPSRMAAPVQPSVDTAPGDRPCVLILPFVNMSGDPEQEYFADGVSEDIITDLGKVSALDVIARNVAFAWKGKTTSSAELAEQMNVTHILEGSVRKSGNRVRITATLCRAGNDAQLWGDRFDRTLDDIFAIQDEISEAIVKALTLKLAPSEKKAIENRSTNNSEAYRYYLMARQFRITGDERHQEMIINLCREAIKLDSGYARAWAQMAMSQFDMHRRYPDLDDGRAAAERALALDPTLADAHAAMGAVQYDTGNLEAALAACLKAVDLDPGSLEGHNFAGQVYQSMRRFEDSIAHYEAAISLDPLAFKPAGMVVQSYMALGDIENERAAARRSLAQIEKVIAVTPEHGAALGFGVNALAALGERDRARDWAKRAMILNPNNHNLHYNLACAMAILGDVDAALDLLTKVLATAGEGFLRWVDADSDFDGIRDDPRFVATMEKARARYREVKASEA